MIEVEELTKVYGAHKVVDALSFTAPPGRVTGFLGPNGSGKSTTMRLVLGLERSASGGAWVGGRRYHEFAEPMREVGAMLDTAAIWPGMRGRAHLEWLARAGGIPRRRVGEVLETVGLAGAAHRRVKELSLGMRQRLGIAGALLGDPGILLLDEPVNGLDPEGVRWVRNFMRSLAAEGRTVLVSSHLMSEMADTADRVVVIGSGRLISETGVEELTREGARVRVSSPHAAPLAAALDDAGLAVAPGSASGSLTVTGSGTARVGEIAARYGLTLHELVQERARLEDVFMELTREASEHRFTEYTAR